MGASNGHIAMVEALVAEGAEIEAQEWVSIHKGVTSNQVMNGYINRLMLDCIDVYKCICVYMGFTLT
jgi:hypothetical protein